MHTRKLLFTNYLFSLDYVWFLEVNAFNFQFRFFGVKYDIFTLRICPNTHHKWPMCFLSCHFFHSNRCNRNVRCVLPILLSCHCFIYLFIYFLRRYKLLFFAEFWRKYCFKNVECKLILLKKENTIINLGEQRKYTSIFGSTSPWLYKGWIY